MRVLIACLALLASGCGGFSWPTLAPEADVESVLLAETRRASDALGVKVEGRITDEWSPGQVEAAAGGQAALAWYTPGVAWYYRPLVAKHVSIEPEGGKETARNVAAHEVAHAVSIGHGCAHWRCAYAAGATPTYPNPGGCE